MSIYSEHLFVPVNEGGAGCDGSQCGVAMGTGLGIPKSSANNLSLIPINQYQASDGNFIGDGDDPATSLANIPAALAAKTAGGSPWPGTLSNGINKRAPGGAFKLKNLKDDLGPNG